MKGFQLVIMSVFGVAIAVAVLLFSGVIPGFRAPEDGFGGTVTIWGSIPENFIKPVINQFNEDNEDLMRVEYVSVQRASFDRTLLEAIATGRGPDAVIFDNNNFASLSNKLFPIPGENFSARAFRDTYIEGGELVTSTEVTFGLPLLVDPLVLYYNREMFSTAGISEPPKSWTDVLIHNDKLKEVDEAKNVVKAGIALGEFRNVTHAKEILATLLLQSGSEIITSNGARFFSDIESDKDKERASVATVNFFNQFSDQNKSTYTWNSAMPDSKDAFVGGLLAMYIGRASERIEIEARNPHLNFDVTLLPQRNPREDELTYGEFRFMGVLRTSNNLNSAVQAIFFLSQPRYASQIAILNGLPPARRDLLAQTDSLNIFSSIFNKSALISHAWFDPNPVQTEIIFREMVEFVKIGRLDTDSSVSRANEALNLIFDN